MKICKHCEKEYKPESNSQNFCSLQCRKAHNYEKDKVRVREWQRNRSGAYKDGKIQCLICGKWYDKVMGHVYQAHGVNEKEYKEYAGLDRGRGIISKRTYELLRQRNEENWDKIKDNLLVAGKKSRYNKGDKNIGKYERSPETLARLKANKGHKKS